MIENPWPWLGCVADAMRVAGVRRIAIAPSDTGDVLTEMELFDTIPAPPPFEPVDGDAFEEPGKKPGTCIAPGCQEPGGWHFDMRYCNPHGRAAAGVKL